MSADLGEVVGLLGGGGGAVWLGRLLVDRFVGRADKERDRRELERDAKIEQVLSAVTRIERDAALAGERASAHAAIVAKTNERVEGLSANYGGRLAHLETQVTELATELRVRKRR